MRRFQLSWLLLLSCIILSCQQNANQQQMQEKVSQWQGKILSVPQISSVNWNDTDSCDLYTGFNYKIIYYVDGDCYACIEALPEIDSVYQIIKTQHSVLLMYVYSSDYERVEKVLNNDIKKIHIPLIYDKANSFYRENKLPLNDPLFRCFLVDKDNKVVVAGSFLANSQMKKLYEKVLNSGL